MRDRPCQEVVMRCRLYGARREWSTDPAMVAVSGNCPTVVGSDKPTRKYTGNMRVISVDSQEDLGDPRKDPFVQRMRRRQ